MTLSPRQHVWLGPRRCVVRRRLACRPVCLVPWSEPAARLDTPAGERLELHDTPLGAFLRVEDVHGAVNWHEVGLKPITPPAAARR